LSDQGVFVFEQYDGVVFSSGLVGEGELVGFYGCVFYVEYLGEFICVWGEYEVGRILYDVY